jgi:hypothetical protein
MPRVKQPTETAVLSEVGITRVTLEISLRPSLDIEDLAALREMAESRGQSVEQVVIEAVRGVIAPVAA